MKSSSALHAEAIRYVVNGLTATATHYVALLVNLHLLGFSSSGLANFCAALTAVMVSFLGNRYFVFRRQDADIRTQLIRFGGLYLTIAILHGIVLYGWTDIMQYDYRTGFLLALVIQTALSYAGNKTLVFKV